MMRDRDIMDIFSKFSSGLSAIVILFAVIPQTSCTPKDSLEETFLQFVDYWKNNSCLFPSSAIFENVMFPNAFPLKACSNEIAMQGVESDQFTKPFGVALCFEFFNKSKELCHAENLQPESLAQLTSNASWDVCASANEVFGNDGKKDGEFRPTIMTSYMDICHNQCAENKAIAPVCRLLVAAVMKYEEHRATGHDESTDSTGNNGNKDSGDGSKDKDNSENVTANTNVGNTGNNGNKDSDDGSKDKDNSENVTANTNVGNTGNNGNKDSDDGSKDKDNSENVTANTNVGNTGNNGNKDSGDGSKDKDNSENVTANTNVGNTGNNGNKDSGDGSKDKDNSENVTANTNVGNTGNNGNKDSGDGSKDKDNSENVTANTNVGNTGNNGNKDSDKKDNDDNKDNTDDDKNDDGNTDELEHQAGKASGVELPGIERDSSSVSFFVIFIIVMVVILAAYALFHKRKAIIAFIVEGSETQSSRADNKKVKYGKLKPSADEELPYLDRSLTTHNYIY